MDKKSHKKRIKNAEKTNMTGTEPSRDQQPLVGFTLDRVKMAQDCLGRAQSNINEIIFHSITREETIKRIAMVASDLGTAITELANARLAGK